MSNSSGQTWVRQRKGTADVSVLASHEQKNSSHTAGVVWTLVISLVREQ